MSTPQRVVFALAFGCLGTFIPCETKAPPNSAWLVADDQALACGGDDPECSASLLQVSARTQTGEVGGRHRQRALAHYEKLVAPSDNGEIDDGGEDAAGLDAIVALATEAAVSVHHRIEEALPTCVVDWEKWGTPFVDPACDQESYRHYMQLGGLLGTAALIAFCTFIGTREQKVPAGGQLDDIAEDVAAAEFADKAKDLKKIHDDELALHSRPGDLWMAIDGVVCDLTEFATLHPGGEQILLEHAGQEAGEAFHEVGHSHFAISEVRSKAVALLVKPDQEAVAAGGSSETMAAKGLIERLFTKEDFGGTHIHKVLGLGALVLYTSHTLLLFSGFRKEGLDQAWLGPDWFTLISVWALAILQFSSFKFNVPRNRILGQPMIWQEWRMHNLIFVMRHILIFTVRWYQWYSGMDVAGSGLCLLLMYGCLFAQLYTVDLATDYLREDKHESLTATWPFWKGCPPWTEKFIKFYYTIAQLQATTLALTQSPFLFMNVMVIFPFQWASVMMTLVRKGVITTAAYHASYLWSLMQVVFLTLLARQTLFIDAWVIWIVLYLVRRMGLSKYALWVGMMIPEYIKTAYPQVAEDNKNIVPWAVPAVWLSWALLSWLIRGQSVEKRARRYLENRPKNLELMHKEKVNDSLVWLRFALPDGYTTGLTAGQHIRVHAPNASQGHTTWNGRANLEHVPSTLSRSYTPVSAPDATTLDLLVKVYPARPDLGFPDGGRGSTYLADSLEVGAQIPISGPHGYKVYNGEGIFLLGQSRKKAHRVCALAGGSGITPALSILREMRAELKAASKAQRENFVQEMFIVHMTQQAEEALPKSWYEPTDEVDSALACRVKDISTSTLPATAKPEARTAGRRALLQSAISDTFPAPADDLVVLVCGPQAFVSELSQPILKELGYQHILTMW